MVRTLLLLGALGAAALGVAAPAGADSADFIKYLRSNGVDVPTPELSNDFVNLGQASVTTSTPDKIPTERSTIW
jgi:hypothetical protein